MSDIPRLTDRTSGLSQSPKYSLQITHDYLDQHPVRFTTQWYD